MLPRPLFIAGNRTRSAVDGGIRVAFVRGSQTVGFVNAQTLEARLGRLRAGVVDADVAFECRVHARRPRRGESASFGYGQQSIEKRHQPARRIPKSHSVVNVGRTSVGAACTPAAAVRSFFVASAFLATALRFFFAAFLPADLNFRVRIAFFVSALRFLGMGIPLWTSKISHCPYHRNLRGVRVARLMGSVPIGPASYFLLAALFRAFPVGV
jgi:hypothetical protein